jgi:hypothetical protein
MENKFVKNIYNQREQFNQNKVLGPQQYNFGNPKSKVTDNTDL